MKTGFTRTRLGGLTLIEVLIIITVLMLAVAFLLPTLCRRTDPGRISRIVCVNNLKQVGVGFHLWAADNNDKFPMQVSITNGGTLEYIGTPETFRHFEVLSNELSTPKILFCPSESHPSRIRADGFGAVASSGVPSRIRFTSNSNLSYFVGADAGTNNFYMLLAGDRNLTNGSPVTSGLLELGPRDSVGWTSEMHANQGEIVRVDCGVEGYANGNNMHMLLDSTTTNRLAMP